MGYFDENSEEVSISMQSENVRLSGLRKINKREIQKQGENFTYQCLGTRPPSTSTSVEGTVATIQTNFGRCSIQTTRTNPSSDVNVEPQFVPRSPVVPVSVHLWDTGPRRTDVRDTGGRPSGRDPSSDDVVSPEVGVWGGQGVVRGNGGRCKTYPEEQGGAPSRRRRTLRPDTGKG